MKVTFLDLDDTKNPLLNAGQARATYEVASRLVKMGHKVNVIASKFPGWYDRVEGGISYKHIGLGSSHMRLNNIFYLLFLPLAVRKLQSDVIVESFVPPVSVCFAPIFTSIPVIGLPSMFAANEFAKKYHLPFHWMEKFGLRLYKYFLPYSDVDSTKAIKLNPKIDYQIVPQGVGDEYFQIKQRKGQYILFLGRLDVAQKGIDLLLQAYALIKDRVGYDLVIAGHGPDESRVRYMIAKLGLTSNVKLVGPVYGARKYKLMSKALFVAFPSKHEEMSLWSLEALAAGLPLVAFDLPEGKWLTREVCLKARPFDVRQYSELLLKAAGSRLIGKLRRSARVFARRFAWEFVACRFAGYFDHVLRLEKGSDAVSTLDNRIRFQKVASVTVGIAAYNEEQNIKQLLQAILDQDHNGFRIDRIIVVSDGSTDRTVELVRSLPDSRIELVVCPKRQGKIVSQRKILKLADADILLLLDADVIPSGRNFIFEIAKVFENDPAVGLVGSDTVAAKPRGFVERVIASSHEVKKYAYKLIKNGDNVYMCHGRALALARSFYRRLRLEDNYPVDAYCYLSCIKMGFRFAFCPSTWVVFRSPAFLSDHIRQSTRFFAGRRKLEEYFSATLVRREYFQPFNVKARLVARFFLQNPLVATIYMFIYFYVQVITFNDSHFVSTWEISTSSKKVV